MQGTREYGTREYRARLALTIMIIALLVLGSRLSYLQVFKAPYYRQISDNNRIRTLPIAASRGTVYDRQGSIIVNNRPSFTVSVIPYEIRSEKQVLATVAEMLELDTLSLRKKVDSPRYSTYEMIPVKRDADLGIISRLAEQGENLPGVIPEAQATRKYPELRSLSHLIGYVGEISEEELEVKKRVGESYGTFMGKMGIEKSYDELLRGRDGADLYEVTARGRVVGKLPDEERVPPLPGLDLQLTLDLSLQVLADSLLKPHPRGCIVALDPNSGEILCLASQPGFDPNSFTSVLTYGEWQELSENPDHPLLNRAIQSAYPPGSTLKLMVAGAALERGLITPQTTFHPCYGGFQLGERFFRCWQPEGHGVQALRGAVLYSCDTYFYQVGLKCGIDLMAEYAEKCGFGRKTGIDLPQEAKGFVPNTEFYDQRYGRKGWTKSLALNLSIGQGEFLVTPLQLTNFFAALCNGGTLYRPHLLEKVLSRSGRIHEYEKTTIGHLPFSKKTISILKDACLAVVNEQGGTGWMAKIPDIMVAGKTGSAQNPHGNTHAWFVAYAPAENPQIVITVLIENAGHGGDVAAPIAREIIKAYLHPRTELVQVSEKNNSIDDETKD
ncbi:MAG: penicillin-binding protein 2 [candidate division Zixibacteria bacterium RBG_16_50_21]|nr:MAG: penicillin-binding protein 2 [candidate division Zixibacteria bacterium RBG_16_50_21]